MNDLSCFIDGDNIVIHIILPYDRKYEKEYIDIDYVKSIILQIKFIIGKSIYERINQLSRYKIIIT